MYEALLVHLVKRIIDYAIPVSAKEKKSIQVSTEAMEQSLTQHLKWIAGYTEDLSLAGSDGPKPVEDIYVPVRLSGSMLRAGEIKPDATYLTDYIDAHGHIVLLGDPGSGKTTTVKWLCRQLLTGYHQFKDFDFPILINFRDFSRETRLTLIEHILSCVGIYIYVRESVEASPSLNRKCQDIQKRVLIDYLEKNRVLLLFDGFDECPLDDRHRFLEELMTLCSSIQQSKIILTSRVAALETTFPQSLTLYLCEFSPQQTRRFCESFFDTEPESSAFFRELDGKPYADLSNRPLFLSQLCLLYHKIGRIPDRPVDIYRHIIRLVLDEWDAQRGLKRDPLDSKYAAFGTDDKLAFLSAIAYELTRTGSRGIFSHDALGTAYDAVYSRFNLNIHESLRVIKEIESHNGIIVNLGTELQFSHLSLQEFLTADYLCRLPTSSQKPHHISLLPEEYGIAAAISSDPVAFVYFLCRQLAGRTVRGDWFTSFIERFVIERPYWKVDEYSGRAMLELISCGAASVSSLVTQQEAMANRLKQSSKILESMYIALDNFDQTSPTQVYPVLQFQHVAHASQRILVPSRLAELLFSQS